MCEEDRRSARNATNTSTCLVREFSAARAVKDNTYSGAGDSTLTVWTGGSSEYDTGFADASAPSVRGYIATLSRLQPAHLSMFCFHFSR